MVASRWPQRLEALAAAISRSISLPVRYSRGRTGEFTVFGVDRLVAAIPMESHLAGIRLANYRLFFSIKLPSLTAAYAPAKKPPISKHFGCRPRGLQPDCATHARL